MLKEFRDFVMRGSIIGIAIGLVMALAFSALVDAFVKYFVSPIVGSLSADGIGGLFRIHLRGNNYIQLGLIIEAAIVFAATAAAVFFFIVKPLKKAGYVVDEVK